MRILVTGGAGFIGSHIVDLLLEKGHSVGVIDNLSTGVISNIPTNAKRYLIDIADPELESVFKDFNPEYVIHHAAQVSVQGSLNDPYTDAKLNILSTISLLNCCSKFPIKKFIYASSAAVYGKPMYLPIDEKHPIQPLSYYGLSKYTPEQYIKLFAEQNNFIYTILRYANVYGPRQDPKGEGGVVSIFFDQLLQNKTPTIYGQGDQTRDFIYVKDIAAANAAALTLGHNQTINISSCSAVSVTTLFESIKSLFSSSPSLEARYEQARHGDITHSTLDNTIACNELHWKPIYSLKKGLSETYYYYLSN